PLAGKAGVLQSVEAVRLNHRRPLFKKMRRRDGRAKKTWRSAFRLGFRSSDALRPLVGLAGASRAGLGLALHEVGPQRLGQTCLAQILAAGCGSLPVLHACFPDGWMQPHEYGKGVSE